MGRSKLVGFVAVCALTLLNIWMAKYVAKPFNEAERLQQVNLVKERRLSDVLVVSVDDIHPLQHLQEAAAMEEKHKSTTTTSSIHLTLSTTYQSRIGAYPRYNDQSEFVAYPRYNEQSRIIAYPKYSDQSRIIAYPKSSDQSVDRNSKTVADINNNWNYANSALVGRQFNGHIDYHVKSIVNDNVNPENNVAAGDADKVINNNVNREVHNDKNISLPYSNVDHDSYQNASSRNGDQLTGWSKQNGALLASVADTWSNHLKALDTVELINIKQSLESLKYILGKLRPNSKRTVLEQLTSAETLRGHQPAGEPVMNVFGDNNVESPQPGRVHVQTRTAVSPLEYYFLGNLKTGQNPPQMAAPAALSQPDVRLLTKLLNESNADHLNTIIKENADAVRNFLPQILLYLQQRQQGPEYQQQQHKPGFIAPGQSESGARETHVRSPDVPALDYNRNTIKEMIRNIATYNKVDTFVDSEKFVENFLRNLQTGHLRKFDISSLGGRRTR
ncbi:hypothetical protein BsWGS_22910 [Bradybaena similaris]